MASARKDSRRPININPIGANPIDAEPTDNILLGDNPPSLYEAIRDANIRALTREVTNSSYNPEQTFSVTINPPVGGDSIITQLTPLQYAALKGLKGTVRYLLNNSNPNLSTKINGLSIKEAVIKYRKVDFDKDEIRYIFDIIETAFRDAMDDFTSGLDKNSKYGDSLDREIDKKLAKKMYYREYDDLKNPKPLPPTAPKGTSVLVDDAKKSGTDDGSKNAPKNPNYSATTVPPKTPQEQEAYDREYDRALSAYYGERDANLNEPSDVGKLASRFSRYYTEPSHQTEVQRIYDEKYERNRSKTSDLVKEAGYVGTYPPSDTLLSGNFFGFGSELNKIVGFNTVGTTPKTDSDAKYKEGLVEFVKNFQSIIGQAKYAGYTDGRKKNAKYTTLGKVSVGGKEYAIDFGKLNTQITELPSTTLDVEPDFTSAQEVLSFLRTMRDNETQTLEGMVGYLRNQSDTNDSSKVKQILKSITVSQKGGFSDEDIFRVRGRIIELNEGSQRTAFSQRLNSLTSTDDAGLQVLENEVETLRRRQEETQAPEDRIREDARNIIDLLTDGPRKQELAVQLASPTTNYKDIRTQARIALQEETQQPIVPDEPGFISKALSKASELGTSAATSASTAAQKLASVPSAVGRSVVTGLGTVATKSQLYNLVQQAFSVIPKYKTKKLESLPTGVSPDDPSLGYDIHPIKRVQAMYDKEFERGYKESMRPVGGTRRKSKNNKRITKKKQHSKK